MTPLHLAHVPIPLSSSGSSIVTVIRELTAEHARRGGRTTVVSAVDRDLRVAAADNRLVDFSDVCPRGWFTRRETLVDFAAGALGMTRPHWGRMQRPVIAAVREARPDVVLIHEGHYALASAPDWRRVLPGTPRVLYVHNPVSRSYGRQELRRLLAALDGMVFVSEDARRRLGERARGLPPSVVVNNGVDDRVFHPRGRMGEGAGRLRITFAGQVSDYKGAHLMLRAIADAGLGPDADVRVVGSSAHRTGLPLTEYELGLRTLADGLGLRVTFIPFCPQPEVAALLRDSDVVCVPSVWQEPFGMAALEAMACGAAVVASDRGGLPEACGGAARLVDPENPAEFAAALRELRDHDALSAWQDRGRRRAAEMTWAVAYETLTRALPDFGR